MSIATIDLQRIVLLLTLLLTAIAAIAQCWNALETRRLVNISQHGAPKAQLLRPLVSTDKWDEFAFSFEVQNVGSGILAIQRADFIWWQKLGGDKHLIAVDATYPVMIAAAKSHTFTVSKFNLLPTRPSGQTMNLPPSQSIEGMLTCICVGLDPVEIHCHFSS